MLVILFYLLLTSSQIFIRFNYTWKLSTHFSAKSHLLSEFDEYDIDIVKSFIIYHDWLSSGNLTASHAIARIIWAILALKHDVGPYQCFSSKDLHHVTKLAFLSCLLPFVLRRKVMSSVLSLPHRGNSPYISLYTLIFQVRAGSGCSRRVLHSCHLQHPGSFHN